MKRHQSNQFTLIELLVVIGIIGILATVVIPAVGDALSDAKRTAAQVACKTFEEDLIKYDISNNGDIKKVSKLVTGLALFKFLSGQTDVAAANITGVVPDDNHTVGTTASTYFEPTISDAAFDVDANGFLQTGLTTTEQAAPFAKNKFGNSFQFVMRSALNAGTVIIQNPLGAVLTIQGVKRTDSKLRVVCLDDSDPHMLITKDGSFELTKADGTALIEGDTDAAGTFKVKL